MGSLVKNNNSKWSFKSSVQGVQKIPEVVEQVKASKKVPVADGPILLV